MFDGWELGPARRERVDRSWLKEPIREFINRRLAEGFKPSTLSFYLNCILRLGDFAAERGVQEPSRLNELIESAVNSAVQSERQRRKWRSVLYWFVPLGIRGITRPPDPTPETPPHAEIVETYATFLREYRGLCDGRICHIRRHCLGLIDFAGRMGCVRLQDVRPEIIRGFIRQEGQRCSRLSLQTQCSALRGFLSYLYRQRLVSTNWATAVMSPRVYADESYPRYMTQDQVDRTLSVIDRTSTQGRRDYAMLLLLATYGIRGIELCRLRLDDIDWRQDRLKVRRRKAGNNTTYPLAASVGNAVVDYLRRGRPRSDSPHVFLSVLPPFGPITTTQTLVHLVCKYAKRAGISVERPGTHTFRYSCAQRLLEGEYPLKNIGDYLGHTHPDSTRHYMKIATDQLREVAMGDGEDVL
jgi:integrase/recombinase XerD